MDRILWKSAREDAPGREIARGVATALLLILALLCPHTTAAQDVVGSGLPSPGADGSVLVVTSGRWQSGSVSGAGLGDTSSNTSTSVDSEVVLFSGTGGKTVKRASGSGWGLFTSGVLSFFTPAAGAQTFIVTPSSANLAALLTNKTGTGLAVFQTNAALITPDLGVPTAISLVNATGLPIGSITGFGTNCSTFLATPTSANLRACLTDESGIGAALFAGGALGAATMTSLNKVAITAPATSATIVPIDGVTWTGPGASGTTAILGANVFTGRQDATGAASTAPGKTGTSLPATCVVGDVYFKSDATAGSNWYGCTSTNTWTVEGGGGSMTYPGSGIGVSNGSAWLTSKASPTGVIVGDTDTQTLANKTLTTPTIVSYTNGQHDHSNAAGGGTLAAAALPTTVTETALSGNSTIADWGSAYVVSCTSCTVELATVTAHTGAPTVVCVDDDSPGYMVLDANGAQTIDGLTTRTMIPGECANVVVRAGEWRKRSGRSIPLTGRFTGAAQAKTAGSWQSVDLDTQSAGSALLYDAANKRISFPRAGTYAITVIVAVDTPVATYSVGVSKNGSNDFGTGSFPAATGIERRMFALLAYTYAAGDYISPQVFLNTTGATVNSVEIQVQEVGPW